MKTSKAILSFLISVAFAIFLGFTIASAFGISLKMWTGIFAVSIIALSVILAFSKRGGRNREYKGLAFMAVQQEFWIDVIIGNLFKKSDFINYCYDESDKVLNGVVVHIPQAGSKPNIVKNRSGAATAVQRTDTDVTYPLDIYTSDPTLITRAEEMEVSYDKMASVLEEHLLSMGETIGDNVLFNWAPTTAHSIARTSGVAYPAYLPSATGNRAKFMKEDLKKARKIMDGDNIPKEDRIALFDSDLFDQLMDDPDLIKRDGVYGGELNLREGAVYRLYGFDIMVRSSTLVYDNSSTPVVKAVGAAGASDDNGSVICWQKNCVAKAMGTVDFFERLKDPERFGDIYSILQKMGGRKRRADGKGVVAIVQAAA